MIWEMKADTNTVIQVMTIVIPIMAGALRIREAAIPAIMAMSTVLRRRRP